MKNKFTKVGHATGRAVVLILTYLFLMIDRITLVPFPFVTSYNAEELSQKPDRVAAYAMIRVTIAVVGFGIYLLFKIF